jgi:hypothetical protein
MSLTSGKVVTFPTGWDLDHFSPNRKTAVFEKPVEEDRQGRPLQAVDVRTGSPVAEQPDWLNGGAIPFDWEDAQSVKPVYRHRKGTGVRPCLTGLSVNGSVFPVDVALEETHYLSTAKAKDGFVGFRLRREGAGNGVPSSLWLMGLKDRQAPRLVDTQVTEFAMLGAGDCLFVTAGHGHRGASSEAFFRSARKNATWNVLDGLERLPALDREFADKDYVEDKLTIRVIDGFGHGGSLALCLFTHSRGDFRSLPVRLDRAEPEVSKSLERTTWQRAVILTSGGERYMTPLFREGNLPDGILLHNSGKVIAATYLWESSGSTGERKVRLSETAVRLQEK